MENKVMNMVYMLYESYNWIESSYEILELQMEFELKVQTGVYTFQNF